MKRAAAVSLIIPAKKGQFLKEIFTISDRLLLDKDDMVQKGYGWMLKESSKLHQNEVYRYVLKHRKDMPRDRFALRHRKDAAGTKSRGHEAGVSWHVALLLRVEVYDEGDFPCVITRRFSSFGILRGLYSVMMKVTEVANVYLVGIEGTRFFITFRMTIVD